jgi:hypothetical protein
MTDQAPALNALVPLLLLSAVPPINAGEVAGFKPEEAEDLVQRGLALRWDVKAGKPIEEAPVVVEPEPKKKAPPAPPAPAPDPKPAPATGSGDGDPDRKEEGAGDAPAAVVPDLALQEFNAAEAMELVADEKDVAKLEALRAGEVLHPKYEGGRATVLAEIDALIAQLKAPATGSGDGDQD